MKGWVIQYTGLMMEAWVGHKGVVTFEKDKRHVWHYKRDAKTAASLITNAKVEVVRA